MHRMKDEALLVINLDGKKSCPESISDLENIIVVVTDPAKEPQTSKKSRVIDFQTNSR